MKKIFYIFVLLLACSCDSPKGEKAEVSEAQEAKIPEPEAVTYHLHPASSEVRWVGSKPTGKHQGTIGIKEGSIDVLNNKVTGGKITIDMDLIEVNDLKSDEDSHMKLTEHLKSDDFFDIETYPYATFEIIRIEPFNVSDKEKYTINNKKTTLSDRKIIPSHKVTGNLSLRDVTLSISFPANIKIDSTTIQAKADFIIDRTLWNVRYNEESEFTDKAEDQLIYDDVVIGFDILASSNNKKLL